MDKESRTRPLLIDACEHPGSVGLPTREVLTAALDDFGLAIPGPGGSVPNPLPKPKTLVRDVMIAMNRDGSHPPYLQRLRRPAVRAAVHAFPALHHRSPANGWTLVAEGSTGLAAGRPNYDF